MERRGNQPPDPVFIFFWLILARVAMLGNLAADAAYAVLIPLAAVLYAAAGRRPLAGLAALLAGVSGGFSANLLPGQLDALLFGITATAAESLSPFFGSQWADRSTWLYAARINAGIKPCNPTDIAPR